MLSGQKIVIVMLAFNAAKTLTETVAEIPHDIIDEIVLVDEASRHETVKLAGELDLTVFLHEKESVADAISKTVIAKRCGAALILS